MSNSEQYPISCPVCFAHWDFRIDDLGRVLAVHPQTPCVPRKHGFNVECSVCEATVRLESDPGRRSLFWCSRKCHDVLKDRGRIQRAEASRKYHQKQHRLDRVYHRRSA